VTILTSSQVTGNLAPEEPKNTLLRAILLALSIVLGCQALWILTAELFRLPSHDFARNTRAFSAAPADQKLAASAAWVGLIRGDLWAEYALTYLNPHSPDDELISPTLASIQI